MHCAGTTLTVIATFFRSCENNAFANAIEQCGSGIDAELVLFAVDAESYWDGGLDV